MKKFFIFGIALSISSVFCLLLGIYILTDSIVVIDSIFLFCGSLASAICACEAFKIAKELKYPKLYNCLDDNNKVLFVIRAKNIAEAIRKGQMRSKKFSHAHLIDTADIT